MIGAPTGPSDEDALRSLLKSNDLTEGEREAFQSMLDDLSHGRERLTKRQREWVGAVRSRLELDAADVENLYSSGKVTIGRPVELAPVLRHLPKSPPGRKP